MFDTVQIIIDEREVELKPTYGALVNLCKAHGDMSAVMGKVARYDFQAYVDVVEQGLAHMGKFKRKDIEESVFAVGMLDLIGPITRYLMLLTNGGKAPQEESDGGEEAADPKTD